jgi:hypothetical protein
MNALARRNALTAGVLVSIVGGIYYYTMQKMKSNELESIAADLDEIRKLTSQITPSPASNPPASKGESKPLK